MRETGVGLGQLVLALDATLVRLVEAPRGLDRPGALGRADRRRRRAAGPVGERRARPTSSSCSGSARPTPPAGSTGRPPRTAPPAAIFVKEPSDAVVARAVAAGTAVVAVDPKARWERLYRLVNHVFEHRRTDPVAESGTDLFALAQSIADRTHGMVSIEDAQSHVLAYSASNDEADELRRLSILGRAGPAGASALDRPVGHLRPACAAGSDVVRGRRAAGVGAAPAAGDRHPPPGRPSPPPGTIWVQQGSRPLADDAEDVLRGAAVLAARIMARLAARPSAHLLAVQQVLGLADADGADIAVLARELGVAATAARPSSASTPAPPIPAWPTFWR